jgi:hypothetical protein
LTAGFGDLGEVKDGSVEMDTGINGCDREYRRRMKARRTGMEAAMMVAAGSAVP